MKMEINCLQRKVYILLGVHINVLSEQNSLFIDTKINTYIHYPNGIFTSLEVNNKYS